MIQSAGILLYKMDGENLKLLLVHPGGPFWAKKDLGAWTIPKGEIGAGEDPLNAALREFFEETGTKVSGNFTRLTSVKQKSGKLIHAWAIEGDMDISTLKSNTFEMPWPPRSGKMAAFPEIDKAQWYSYEEAQLKIIPGQQSFLRELRDSLYGEHRIPD